MKVLHIISSGGMYGAEAVILNLARTLRDGPHECVLGVFWNFAHPNLEIHEGALKEGFDSRVIPCQGQMDRSAIANIRELVERSGADVVHAHGYKADSYVYLALRGKGVPLVSTCHTWYDTDLLVSLYGRVDRFVLRKYARVVAVSDEVRQRLLQAGVRNDNIRMVSNGIDFARTQRPTAHWLSVWLGGWRGRRESIYFSGLRQRSCLRSRRRGLWWLAKGRTRRSWSGC
jgi:glycosyltransferase involved in cell wall biosynthesis